MCGFVDIQRPTVRGKRFQLDQQGYHQQEERQRPTTGQRHFSIAHEVDIQRSGSVVGEYDPDQQQGRYHLCDDQVFDTGTQGALVIRQQNHSAGGNRDQFKENKQVEDIACHNNTAERHNRDQQNCHSASTFALQHFFHLNCRNKTSQVDQQQQRGFR